MMLKPRVDGIAWRERRITDCVLRRRPIADGAREPSALLPIRNAGREREKLCGRSRIQILRIAELYRHLTASFTDGSLAPGRIRVSGTPSPTDGPPSLPSDTRSHGARGQISWGRIRFSPRMGRSAQSGGLLGADHPRNTPARRLYVGVPMLVTRLAVYFSRCLSAYCSPRPSHAR